MAKKASKSGKGATIKLKLVRSVIGSDKKQREILKGLGLRRINHVVERVDSPGLRGMLSRVAHLVEVES